MSADKKERCECCNRLTPEGEQKWAARARLNPIYGTDLSKPKSKVVDDVRSGLVHLRGQLQDFARAFPGWSERVDFAVGGITCVISALHPSVEELRKFEIQTQEESK